MTREEVIQGIADLRIWNFGNIPKDHLDHEVIRLWIATGQHSLNEMPLHLITDSIRIQAVEDGLLCRVSMKSIKPSHTKRYEEIALLAIKNMVCCILEIEPRLLNNEFLEKALQVNGRALLYLLAERDKLASSRIKVTQDLIDLAVSRSSSYFRWFRKDQYSPSAIRECLKTTPFDCQGLMNIGQFDVLVDEIRKGNWPFHFPDKPSSLKNGIAKMMRSPQHALEYRAYVMTYPIEDVISGMKNHDARLQLLSMYSRSELAPFLMDGPLANDQVFKGRLLENELGL